MYYIFTEMHTFQALTSACKHVAINAVAFAVVRYSYYQYGSRQGDENVNCGRDIKSCSSNFISVPKIQIFNGQYKRMKVRIYVAFLLNHGHISLCQHEAVFCCRHESTYCLIG